MAPTPRLGPYTRPAVRKGDQATCPSRDAECVVTDGPDAPDRAALGRQQIGTARGLIDDHPSLA
jgi:hypothetical protein